ncbi:helix-turn-helix domain-containing protein [Paenibacillus sp. MMS18-CY102]|uniref:helix-turn-helix domain-containing protein n=1 Tax=Paenibacillus sp. MMS18-CY102 TaxID=2682849 RepID=UPI00136667B2|nr:helix-turn-helix transcriptional regulator [Paenibacillus sp. MMS18-CY102]MWC26663.1 helix-turn-helix domain-containing protein [Paenibacillus sp. MMS18-CY102]
MKLANLEKERILNDFTQEDVANEIGCARSTYANWESGKREPDFDSAQKLANTFGVSVDYLIGNSKFRNADELAQKYIELVKQVQSIIEHADYKSNADGVFLGGSDKYSEDELEVARAAAKAAIDAMRKLNRQKDKYRTTR